MRNVNKFIPFIVVIAALVAISFFLKQPDDREEGTYKIGAIVPITGPGATLGQPLINGLTMALEEVNERGGINGREVTVLIQDGKLEGTASASAAVYLLSIENPDVFVVLFGLPAMAVSPVLEEGKKPFIYEAFIRSPLENPYAFKANFDALVGCEQLVQYAKDHGRYQKLGVLMARAEYNELCMEGIKNVESNVSEYWYSFGETDFRTLLLKVNSDEVDTLLTIGIDFEYLNIFKQLSQLGYPIKIMCATASECIFPDVVAAASPGVLEGTLSIDFISPDIDQSEFGRKYAQRYPDSSFTEYVYGAVGYEEGLYITKAMESCKSGDSECLKQALEETKDYPTVIGSSGFQDRVLQLNTSIMEYQDGQWVILD